MGNVKLHAVLHEKFGAEEFQEFYQHGTIHFDEKQHFFGPHLRRKSYVSLLGLLGPQMREWKRSADEKGITGNFQGDGMLLGGLVVIGPGDQGILYQHLEEDFGERCDMDQVMAAVDKINQAQ